MSGDQHLHARPSGQSWDRGFSLSYDLNLSDALNAQLQKCPDETTTSEVFLKVG